MGKITFSIVNTDNWTILSDCLRSIAKSDGFSPANVEAVVIDNASTSLATDAFFEEFRWARVVRRDQRHGFGSNHNEAFRSATGDLFVVLNDDTLLGADFLRATREFFERRPSAAVVGPWVDFLDGSRQGTFGPFPSLASEALLWSVGQFGRAARWLIDRRTMAKVTPIDERRVPWLCGVCMVWRRTCFEQLGGFDEAFRIYYEDAEICHRAQRLWPGELWFSPNMRLQHLEGATMGSRRTGDHRREVENIVSAAIYFDRTGGPRSGKFFWRFARMANSTLSVLAGVLRWATLGKVELVARADRRLRYIAEQLRRREGLVPPARSLGA